MTHVKQTPFENIVAKREIAHNEQYLHLPQCFQLYLIVKLLFVELFHIFAYLYFMLSAEELFNVGKGEAYLFGIDLQNKLLAYILLMTASRIKTFLLSTQYF